MQDGPAFVTSRTPSQGTTGAGGFQRKSPTGGSANGMPRKIVPPSGKASPRTMPPVTKRSIGAAAATDAVMAAAARNRIVNLRISLVHPFFAGNCITQFEHIPHTATGRMLIASAQADRRAIVLQFVRA